MNSFQEKEFLDLLFDDLDKDKLILPTLPEIALKVRDVLEDDGSSLGDVAKIIGQDISLSARLIQVVNSPLLRSAKTIDNIDSAVMRMGSNMIRNLVAGMVMEQLFQATSDLTDKYLRATWQRSLAVSSFALALSCKHPNLDRDQAMLAGLVHDIGILPILTRAEEYPELLADEAALNRIISKSHSRIGAEILTKWNFSEEMILVALEHENALYDSVNGPDYVDIVIVAGLQCDTETKGLTEGEDWSSVPAFSKLGLATEVEVIDMSVG